MSRTVIAKWRRNSREEIAVALDNYQNADVIDVRCWYEAANGEQKPGRQGITLSVSRHLEPLATALNDALKQAREKGLLSDIAKEEPANA